MTLNSFQEGFLETIKILLEELIKSLNLDIWAESIH
jgi:hypothetical protein